MRTLSADLRTFALPPSPDARTGAMVLKSILSERGIMRALETLHGQLGEIFRISLPGFSPIVMAGPRAARFVYVEEREKLLWRNSHDPVTQLLRQGLLVLDGPEHQRLRRQLSPALHGSQFEDYSACILGSLEDERAKWSSQTIDMFASMRRVTLVALMRSLFRHDPALELDSVLPLVQKAIGFISPGLWILDGRLLRPGYRQAIRQIDGWLLAIIRARRASRKPGTDQLGTLLDLPELTDGLIRDQMLTMLIAGHDTNTSALAWASLMISYHPDVQGRLAAEIEQVLGGQPPDRKSVLDLRYLDAVVKETLRLYPPIHVSNRLAAADLEYRGHRIPAGERLMLSIYLTHRDPGQWADPHSFDPDRFMGEVRPATGYRYIPFGGGPRNCIGAGFGMLEAKLVLARLIQLYRFGRVNQRVRIRMRATLEPSPGALVTMVPR